MTRQLCLALATIAASGLFTACEADDSLPTRPRTAIQPSDSKNQIDAEHRALEAPGRSVPTGAGKELPGQSNAASISDRSILTLDSAPTAVPHPTNPDFPVSGFYGPSGRDAIGHTHGPVTVYNRDAYKGPIPNLPQNPGTVPMTGSTPAPGGDWTVDYSWGQGLTLNNYPHRPWPNSTVVYPGVEVKHNPTYYFNLLDHSNIAVPPDPRTADVASTVAEIPTFFLTTLALPVLAVLEPPLAQRVTDRPSLDPNFNGSFPATGTIVPAPTPGTLHWDYPFLNPDGTVKPASKLPRTTLPATP